MASTTVYPPTGTNAESFINSAINTINANGGGTVTLAAGSFVINSPIIMKSNVTLQGTLDSSGNKLTEVQLKAGCAINDTSSYYYITNSAAERFPDHGDNTATHFLIGGTYANNITICNFVLNPNCASYWIGNAWNSKPTAIERGRGFITGIYLNGGNNVNIHHMHFNNGTRSGFGDAMQLINGGGSINFYDNAVFPAMGHEGIYVKQCQGEIKVYNNYIQTHSNSGIRIADSAVVDCFSNIIFGPTSTYSPGLLLCGPGIQVDHNYNERGGRSLPLSVNIFDNIIKDIFGPGVSKTSTASSTPSMDRLWLHHNIITGCGMNADADYYASGGIHVGGGCSNTFIEHNTINGCFGQGIALMPYSTSSPDGTYSGVTKGCVVTVNNNNITNIKKHTKLAKFKGYGIGYWLSGGNSSFNCTNNNIWNCATNVVYLVSLDSSNIGVDPQYVVSGSDFHLKSNYGSWHNDVNNWVKDSTRSLCIRLTGTFANTEVGRYNGTWQQSKQSDVLVNLPVADFSAINTVGTVPLVVAFSDLSTNNPTSWYWTFGDGGFSTEREPIHVYSAIGVFTVALSVSNSAGSHAVAKVGYVNTTNEVNIPKAEFNATPKSGLEPLSVKFTDMSVNNPTVWAWKFGDGDTSTESSPTHIYTKSGMYTVELTVTNSAGTNTIVKENYINVALQNPYILPQYDNSLQSENPDTAINNLIYLPIGSAGTDKNRGLLWFNLDAYEGKNVLSAKLKLYWCYPSVVHSNDTIVEIYRPSKVWDPNSVTWNYWDNDGGDWYDKNNTLRGNVPYSSIKFDAGTVSDNSYYDFDVTQLIQEYVENEYSNYGIFIKSKLELNDIIKFYSLDCGTNLAIPKLEVTYNNGEFIMRNIIVAGDGTGDYNCDGVDDHIQINEAIKAVYDHPTLYSGVYLKGPFTYNISNTILTAGTLEGDSTAVIKLVANANWDANKPLIRQYTTGLDGITIRGFKIDGNRGQNTNVISGKYYYNIIAFDSCTNINIYNMYLTNNHNDALYLENCSNIKYYNNAIYLCGHDGLYAVNCTSIDAYDNDITVRTNSGLRLYNSNIVKFYNNVITSEGSGGAGIEIQKYGTPVMTNIEVYNNRIYNTVLAGIWCFASSSYNSNTTLLSIHNNVIYGCGTKSSDPIAGGIVINGFNANLENNTIDGCYNSGIGVRETYSPSASITGTITLNLRNNIITYTSGYAIEYDTLANHTIVQQNNCLYQNTNNYKNVTAPSGDVANITSNPLYVDRTTHNYYLQSKAGRWDQTTNKWTTDSNNSPCIDAGYSGSSYSLEPIPNGDRINMGAYGNTNHASYTGETPVATNHAPILTAIPNKTVEIGSTLTFTVSAYDEDDDTLTYSISPIPTNASINSSSGVFTWTPTTGQDGTYNITFTVSDGTTTDTQVVGIGVIKQETYTMSSGDIVSNRIKQASPDVVYNTSAYVEIGARKIGETNNKLRSLVLVDLSEYTGKVITSAILSVFWYYPDGIERNNDTILEVYRPLPWDTDYVTWNKKNATNNWVTPGGDWFDSAGSLNGNVPFATASFGNDTVPDNAYHNLDVTALVQDYVDGTYTNSGFLLKAQVEDDNWIAFYSQRWTSNARLKLTVQYTD